MIIKGVFRNSHFKAQLFEISNVTFNSCRKILRVVRSRWRADINMFLIHRVEQAGLGPFCHYNRCLTTRLKETNETV